MIARLSAALAALLLASCASVAGLWSDTANIRKPEDVPPALEKAQASFEAGESKKALDIAQKSSEVRGLDPSLRDTVSQRVEIYATRYIRELAEAGNKPKKLEDLVDMGLPRQLAVTAGITAARIYRAAGRNKKVHQVVQEIDRLYPTHHERVAAGELLADAGLAQSVDTSNWLWIWPNKYGAFPILEYLVLNYPSAVRCDEAYLTLARLYEDKRDWEYARERYEDLVLYHPDSPHAIEAAAAVPHLRLKNIQSPEYDRQEVVTARREVERWLQLHPDHALAESVRLDYADCLVRLTRSDLSIAHFYRKVKNPYGARFHASRAQEEARQSGSEPLIEEVQAVLAALPEVEELPADQTRLPVEEMEIPANRRVLEDE